MSTDKILQLELPLELAPVLNSYATMPSWRRAKLRKQVDMQVLVAKQSWQGWDMGVTRKTSASIVKGRIKRRTEVSGGRRRKLVLTRCSSRQPDELSCDVLGGKIPIDRLVQACVLRDDNQRWLEREGRWQMAKPGQGKVIVEVFDL